jgi:membrane fusion protein, multidrug efflux system
MSNHIIKQKKAAVRFISAISVLLLLAIFPLIIFFLSGCGKGDKEAAAPTPEVTVSKVKKETVPIYLDYVGLTQSIESVTINARVEGFLIERAFVDGSDVSAGDLLFVIDPRPFEASLAAARAELAENTAALSYANEQVRRYKPLVEKDYVTRDAYDQYITQAKEARAAVEAARANVVQAELNLGYCTMIAPFDGRIGRRLVDVGNLVGAAQATELATLVKLDPIYVYFSVAERDTPQVLAEQNKKPLSASIVLADGSTHPQSGTVDFIDNAVDTTTGTVEMRAVIPNTAKTLLPGQYAKVQLLLKEQPDTIVVPQKAIGEQQGDTFVYVVGKDNKVEFRAVTAGSAVEGLRVIEKGLTDGEMVVVDGLQKIKPGITVKPETASEKKNKIVPSPKPTGYKGK